MLDLKSDIKIVLSTAHLNFNLKFSVKDILDRGLIPDIVVNCHVWLCFCNTN